MSQSPRLNSSNRHPAVWRPAAILILALSLFVGCQSPPDSTSPGPVPDLDAELARAAHLREPALVLVAESGHSKVDDSARRVFSTVASDEKSTVFVLLDLAISRNRAVAARYHVSDTPLLLGLSSRGLIIARDQKPLTPELVRGLIADLARWSPELDSKLAALEAPVASNGNDAIAQLELGDFLFAQKNAREAIPHFETVAHSNTADQQQRVHAWVQLASAHLWIAEPEKARHEAQELLAILGPVSAEARAGANLAFGMQDAALNRPTLARSEFEAAITASPDSDYSRQAAEHLSKLP
jgi:tetratricopeptide (TPR) repeat protein